MNKAKLLGYTKLRTDHGVNSDGHDEGSEVYTFYIQIKDDVFSFSAEESWGSCGSGYTSASWGDIDFKLITVSPVTFFYNFNKQISGLIAPSKDTFLPLFNNELQKSIIDPDPQYQDDAVVESVKSTDGKTIVYATGNGGCSYYPSGTVTINDKLFN